MEIVIVIVVVVLCVAVSWGFSLRRRMDTFEIAPGD